MASSHGDGARVVALYAGITEGTLPFFGSGSGGGGGGKKGKKGGDATEGDDDDDIDGAYEIR